MAKEDTSRVTLTHPSGKFTVAVSPSRAEALVRRGYLRGDDGPEPTSRRELIARAKELGVPARGTNAELEAAIAESESLKEE